MFDSDKIWRCECGDAHFVSITSFDETDRDGKVIEAWRTFNIDGHFCAPNRRYRLKQLWKMLRQGKCESWIGVVLDIKTMTEIRDEMNRLLEVASKETKDES
jgi:hypothetical protein